ncbi:hypothetical protein V865_001999 [Kwoniella europaea PYCC6329]|uniref:Rho-GAP domain-containing protein n=1 Tax=Kwoniella europaea PYCC6329 TaxID=1423913 RepID=A0AAX4KBM1_9TREE
MSLMFPRMRRMTLLDLPTRSAVLAEILQRRNATSRELEGCLVEFVIKAWKEGKKVREWCRDIQQILEVIRIPDPLRDLIRSVPMKTLLPFVNLPSNAYFPTTEPPLPPPLIPTELLPKITRSQLIEALSRLSVGNQSEGSRPFCDEPLIHELCLSYISMVWKDKKLDIEDNNLVDWISKSLTEVEFELQLQGESGSTNILPILHGFRFQLGFVTCSQLITRFNSNSNSTAALLSIANPTESFDTTATASTVNQDDFIQLESFARSWIHRRLSAGLAYQAIFDELSSIKNRIEDRENKDLIDTTLENELGFCNNTSTDLSTDQSGLLWSSPSSNPIHPNLNTGTTTKTEPEDLYSQLASPSALSLLTFRMGRKRSFGHHTPKWLYHKRNNSSSSKLRFPTSDHSRPSSGYFGGTVIPESSSLTSPSTLTFSCPSHGNDDIRQSTFSENTITRQRTTFRDDLTSSLMSLTDPEDVRTVLLNQLMEMRYHLHGHEDESWFLGGGREHAEELLSHLEKKMIGKKDLMGLKEVFVSMRSAFDLPPLVNTSYSAISSDKFDSPFNRGTVFDRNSVQRDSLNLDQFFDEVAQLPDTLEESSSGENEDGHYHGADSEDGKDDHAEPTYQPVREEGKRILSYGGSDKTSQDEGHAEGTDTARGPFGRRTSASAHSVLTMTSMFTTDSQTEGTRLSCFEIQEAHREYHTESQAIEYHFPLPPSTPPPPPPSASQIQWERYERCSASVPDVTDIEGKYTRLPPKVGSLRRSKTRIAASFVETTSEELRLSTVPSTLTQQPSPALPEDDQEELGIISCKQGRRSSIEPISPTCPLSPSSMTEDSPSKSTFDTHIVTPTTIRHPYPYGHHQPLSTLSSEATLYHRHDHSHLITPDRRRASLGPIDKNRRQIHRHFAIFDGEQVSPSKELRELGMGMGKSYEDPVTPATKLTHFSESGSAEVATLNDTTTADVTPKVRPRSSKSGIPNPLRIVQPRQSSSQMKSILSLSRPNGARNISSSSASQHVTASTQSQSFVPKSPIPLVEVLDLFRRHQESEDGLSLWEVEDSLYRLINIEKDRVERSSNGIWDEEKKNRVRWLIDQVAIMLGDPIYVAPISRVVASLSSSNTQIHRPESITLTTSIPSQVSSFSVVKVLERPPLPRYKSQPQFPTSFLSSPPRPEPVRPNILRRHTRECLSVGSIDSASSIYSTPSATDSFSERNLELDMELEEEMVDFPCLPSPSIGGVVIAESTRSRWASVDREKSRLRRVSKGYGYVDWDVPLPQRMEWPVPQIHHRQRQRQYSEGSTGTFGR